MSIAENEVAETETTESTEGETPQGLTLSDAAVAKVAELIAAESSGEELALRVAVKPGGCSGMSYDMYFDSEFSADDQVHSFSAADKTVKVVIDPTSAPLIAGASLDYKDGLQGAGFAINNPSAKRSCGCGNSFC